MNAHILVNVWFLACIQHAWLVVKAIHMFTKLF